MTSQKKLDKSQAKSDKKAAKTELKQQKKSGSHASPQGGPSPAVRYAEFVRGALYVLTGTSILVAIVLGQRGAIISLDDVINSLFAASAGKIILILIGLALLIYGFKHLRIVR